MIQVLKYTEYVYLAVAVLSIVKVVSLWETGGQRLFLFVFFFAVSLGMFFFRRKMRLRMENQMRNNTP